MSTIPEFDDDDPTGQIAAAMSRPISNPEIEIRKSEVRDIMLAKRVRAMEKAVQSSVPMTIGTEYTVSWRSDGTTMRVGVDGTETAYGGTVGAITDLSNPLNIGRNGGGNIAGQFDVREIVICNADLSGSDRSNLLAWMAAA